MNLITGYYLLFFPTILLLSLVDAAVYRITKSDRRFYKSGFAYVLVLAAIAGACILRASMPPAPMEWLKAEILIAGGLAALTLVVMAAALFFATFNWLLAAIRGSEAREG